MQCNDYWLRCDSCIRDATGAIVYEVSNLLRWKRDELWGGYCAYVFSFAKGRTSGWYEEGSGG